MKPSPLFDESWFYGPDVDESALRSSQAIALPSDESHHAFQVLRLREGQTICVSNGVGQVFEGLLTGSSKAGLFQPTRLYSTNEAPPKASLAMAVLKGKDTEDPIAACCQLPLSDVFLLRTEHAQMFAGQDHEKLITRLRQKSIVALKQARKAFLTRIHAPSTLAQWQAANPDSSLVYAHPGPDTLPEKPTTAFSLFIGPEGGFSKSELEWFIQQPQSFRLGLGSTRLRAEQAPLVGLGKLMGLRWL